MAFGIASIALTAATFGLFVFAPAMMAPEGESLGTLAATARSPVVKEAVIIPTRIEVRGTRETTLASASMTPANREQDAESVSGEVPTIHRVSGATSGPVMSAQRAAERNLPLKR